MHGTPTHLDCYSIITPALQYIVLYKVDNQQTIILYSWVLGAFINETSLLVPIKACCLTVPTHYPGIFSLMSELRFTMDFYETIWKKL